MIVNCQNPNHLSSLSSGVAGNELASAACRNLSEETQKGMLEKARSGIYPSCAPVGYRNVDGPHGKRILVPDGETGPVITELFEQFRKSQHSIKSLAAQFRQEGRTLGGRRLHPSLLHQILRKRLYMGDFD
jgi:DNA invertase Pin-like site-specific DNA recombinase